VRALETHEDGALVKAGAGADLEDELGGASVVIVVPEAHDLHDRAAGELGDRRGPLRRAPPRLLFFGVGRLPPLDVGVTKEEPLWRLSWTKADQIELARLAEGKPEAGAGPPLLVDARELGRGAPHETPDLLLTIDDDARFLAQNVDPSVSS